MTKAIIKIEKSESSNIEILQENICFLQKELLAKNDLIKSLMETQTVVLLEAIPNLKEKQQDQQNLSNVTYRQQIHQHYQGHQNNQQKFLKNTKQQQNHHRQFQNQRQQHQLQKEREQQQQDGKQQQQHQQKLQHQTRKQQQKQQKLHSDQSKSIFLTNLHQNVTVDDIYQLFGLRSADYLRNNCHTEMDHFNNVDQPFTSATVTAPAHGTFKVTWYRFS